MKSENSPKLERRPVSNVTILKLTTQTGQENGSPKADIVESLVVDAVGLVGVLDKLVDRQCGVVGLHDSIRNL